MLTGVAMGVWQRAPELAVPAVLKAELLARPSHAAVKVIVESTPPGATVNVEGMKSGVTPVELSFPASDAGVAITLALEGYAPAETFITLATDQRLSFGLQQLRPPRTSRKSKREKQGDPLDEKW